MFSNFLNWWLKIWATLCSTESNWKIVEKRLDNTEVKTEMIRRILIKKSIELIQLHLNFFVDMYLWFEFFEFHVIYHNFKPSNLVLHFYSKILKRFKWLFWNSNQPKKTWFIETSHYWKEIPFSHIWLWGKIMKGDK